MIEPIIIGNAKNLTILRKCIYCNKTYLLNCDDYIFNNFGNILQNNHQDEWICNDCYKYISKIKNL